MPLNVELVNVTPNEIVWLVQNEGGEGGFGTSVQITTSDLAAACVDDTWGRAASARLRQVCRAGLDGLGNVAAGAWTQALARDLMLCDGAVQAGNAIMPRGEVELVWRSGATLNPRVDIGVDGAGLPQIDLATVAADGTFYVKLRLRSTPGVR